jgi:GH15 family glucan-1,4-alpha-glucosidase
LAGNIQPFQDGLLESPQPCLLAGLGYRSPWTRDAAFNAWFALSRLAPKVALNTLLSVLKRRPDGEVEIGGQYWDSIIWAQGAWEHYQITQDSGFLALAYQAIRNSLGRFEREEYDPRDGLFRGGACFQDGIAGYPDFYTPSPGQPSFSGIDHWLEQAGAKRHPVGAGVPCKALSTNCLYYRSYHVVEWMARELGTTPDTSWKSKAAALRAAINRSFWSDELGRYRYLVDAPGNDDRQEGLGLAFALLFGLADNDKAQRIFESVYLTPHGIPCLWPTYPRYAQEGEFGRHSGPIWPQVNATWALACLACGHKNLALQEFELLVAKALRDNCFIEVYHPQTGVPYGGLQEQHGQQGMAIHGILPRQSWCASGFLAMATTLFCAEKTC